MITDLYKQKTSLELSWQQEFNKHSKYTLDMVRIDSKIREALFNTKYNTDMTISSSLRDDWAELSQILIEPLLDLIEEKDIIYFSQHRNLITSLFWR